MQIDLTPAASAGVSAASACDAAAQKLLALLGSLAARALGAAEELGEIRITIALGVLDVGLQAQHVREALLDEPDDVVVLVLGAGDLPGLLGASFHVSSFGWSLAQPLPYAPMA